MTPEILAATPPAGVEWDCLLIGYGSELRGDDAVGRLAARIVRRWALPGVCALDVPQLAPELAETVAQARRVVFLDASAEPMAGPELRRLSGCESPDRLGHAGGPEALLGLAAAVYGRAPAGYLLKLPASQFELGARLSPEAERGLRAGAALLGQWLRSGAAEPV